VIIFIFIFIFISDEGQSALFMEWDFVAQQPQ